MSENSHPTIGLALSGSGSRLVFYIGFLEELKKAGIPIDYISACSGGSIVAASFACGTLDDLKEFAFNLDLKTIRKYLTKGKGGFYSFDGADELALRFTKNLRFEDVKPLLGFVAVDVESGEQIVLSMGDIFHALKVSCSVPLIMESIKWGGRTLVDGGLLNIVPVDVLKQVGVDICIGINMRGNPHIFPSSHLTIRKFFNLFKKALFVDYWGKVWESFFPSDEFEDQTIVEQPGMFTVLGKSMDLAIAASKRDYSKDLECDIMISPDVAKFGIKNFEEASEELYEFGRQTAIEYIPKIRELMEKKKTSHSASSRVSAAEPRDPFSPLNGRIIE